MILSNWTKLLKIFYFQEQKFLIISHQWRIEEDNLIEFPLKYKCRSIYNLINFMNIKIFCESLEVAATIMTVSHFCIEENITSERNIYLLLD